MSTNPTPKKARIEREFTLQFHKRNLSWFVLTQPLVPTPDFYETRVIEITAVTRLQAQLAAAKKALEFYADSENYSHFPATSDPECGHFVGFIEEAAPGDTARAALANINSLDGVGE